MSRPGPHREYVSEPSMIERWAGDYLAGHHPRVTHPGRPRTTAERQALIRACRRRVLYAALAGILSGAVIGGMEWYMRQEMAGGMQDMTLREQLPYWAGFFAVAGVISAIEILFLYWNALRGVLRISHIAQAPLQHGSHALLIKRGLARAALELPSPRDPVFGIDPYAQMQRWKLTARAVLYRMKVGVTSFVLRILMRRLFGRMALRGLLPLVTGPLYAVWNALISYWIMRQARENALGPFAIDSLVADLEQQIDSLGDDARQLILHGVGEMLMRHQDAHANHVYLLSRLLDAFAWQAPRLDVDWPRDSQGVARLNANERRWLLATLSLAAVLVGPLRGRRREFLEELYRTCDQPFDRPALNRLRRAIMDGETPPSVPAT
ncbi:hypothetical protein IEI94_04500 [Halomonas sp. ML-15]|uniref:LBF_2804 family protein n=1 Tax=Halomonas sp. ML-15 TaxID=2773305 RepID=UPI001747586C|nr:hypothetical protein [Halomonas sp. ML-15]MBD3895109.1 hypothetical protein [Halomonas sp. ML-15]